MASSRVSYQKVSLKYGIFVGLAHIVYFLLMGLVGLHNMVELSFFSGIFLAIGICIAIANYKKARNGSIHYFQGLAIGATVGVVSSTLLALFMALYLSMFDSSYLASLQASSFFPESISILSVFVITIIYGSWPGLWIGFIAMQWFKRADHTIPEKI